MEVLEHSLEARSSSDRPARQLPYTVKVM